MADTNVTGGTCRELTKYRMTFAAAMAALALASWMFQTAYEQHIKVLQIGDQTGERLQMRGLIQHQEGAQHEQR
jgi:uroporphyrinogen-III synthase